MAPKFFITAGDLKSVYDKLESPAKVAKLLGVSKKTILNWMVKYDILRDKRKVMSEACKADLVRLVLEGRTTAQIAATVGFSVTTILSQAKALGIVPRDPVHVGLVTTEAGYIKLLRPAHPRADSKGYVHEHILVAEDAIGRLLVDGEVVHHKDRVKHNNEISNLQVMTDFEHRSLHRIAGDSGRKRKVTQQDIV